MERGSRNGEKEKGRRNRWEKKAKRRMKKEESEFPACTISRCLHYLCGCCK